MSKRFTAFLCMAAVLFGLLSPPAHAAQGKTYFPVTVDAYTEEGSNAPRVKKVYHLSLTDDPAGIPTADFERDGIVYHLLDLTQETEVGVDTKDYTETISQDSSTGDMAAVLKQLDAQREVETEDGYSGVLLLDHTSVSVKAKGYQTSTKNLSATRTYPDLSDADLSLVPKTIQENGKTLTLNNVQWANGEDESGQHFTATATYTGTTSSRYATGYTVTADYTGQVSKTNCEIATYTAVFGGTYPPSQELSTSGAVGMDTEVERTENPEVVPATEAKGTGKWKDTGSRALSVAGCAGGAASLAAAGIWFAEKRKERRS